MPLLERDRELAECEAAVEAAAVGRGGMVVVEGPPGIGKSELLREAGERARRGGACVLTARGVEVERELPFGGVRQLLEPVVHTASPEEAARIFSGAATPAARLFEPARGEETPLADAAFATCNALYWVVAGLAEAQPLVVVVDDAHWLDRPSVRLLDFMAPRIEELAAAVFVATRPPQEEGESSILGRLIAEPDTRVVRPGPLSSAAVAELARAGLGGEPDRVFSEACADATGGTPFYVSELVRELARRGIRGTAAEAAAVAEIAPRKISLALRFRGAAASDGMALARAVAVLGDGARLEDVAVLAGLSREAAASAADALVRDSILAPGPALTFAHPIVRSAVYADIGPRECALVHGHAARHLDSVGVRSERVAAHLMRTDPGGDPWAVERLRAAAGASLAQGAPGSAVHYLRRALAEPPDQAVRASVLLELGRAEASTAHPDATVHLSEAYALARDAQTRADAALAGAISLLSYGRVSEAVARLAAAADEVAHQDPDRALELEAQLVALAMYDCEAAAQYLPRLDGIDEDLVADSTAARMMLCQLAYRRLWESRDAARAAQLAERALADGLLLAERGTDTPELGWAGAALTLVFADRTLAAAKVLAAALAQARDRGSRLGFGLVAGLRAELAHRQGALQDAEADTHAALAVMGPSGQLSGVAWVTGMLVTALIERGALDEADDALRSVGVPAEQLPPQPQFGRLLSARGRLRLARGDIDGGLADLHECGRRNEQLATRHPLLCPWRADAALAHRARGELIAARALADEELAVAQDWGTPGAIGAAQRLTGLLASGDEAVTLLREAAAALGESPARLEHAQALIDLGATLRRTNRRSDARQHLSRGLDLADRCGAILLSRRAQQELRALGARPRRARLTGLESLTASERRVAEMAAQGLGNIEIAQTLFVTRKTVEKHLGNAYAKLGLKSRAELSAQLLEQGDGVPDPLSARRERAASR